VALLRGAAVADRVRHLGHAVYALVHAVDLALLLLLLCRDQRRRLLLSELLLLLLRLARKLCQTE
jgi:hypothetical protein